MRRREGAGNDLSAKLHSQRRRDAVWLLVALTGGFVATGLLSWTLAVLAFPREIFTTGWWGRGGASNAQYLDFGRSTSPGVRLWMIRRGIPDGEPLASYVPGSAVLPPLTGPVIETRTALFGWPSPAMLLWADFGVAPPATSGTAPTAKLLEVHRGVSLANAGTDGRLLPLSISWPGYLLNTAFWACVLFLTGKGLQRGYQRIKAAAAERAGCCAYCGYNLRGLAKSGGTRCPECGKGAATP
jgi:hypothetical protein